MNRPARLDCTRTGPAGVRAVDATWGGNADTWRIIDGKLYIFGGGGSRDAFMVDPARNLALAEKYWKEEVEGSNAFWQRSKRLVFRVPHYKSGEELAQEVARAKAAAK